MKLFNIFSRTKPAPRRRSYTGRRGYTAATYDRLSNDWKMDSMTADGELRQALKAIRARSRDLAINNDYYRRYLNMCVEHIIGPRGVKLQSKAKQPDGTLDKTDNLEIERAWKKWGEKGSPTVCGRYSFLDLQWLIAETVPRDGEILFEKVYGEEAGNEFGFALNLLEPDQLDERYNGELPNGNFVTMGIELNQYRRPVNYYFLKANYAREYTAYDQRWIKVPADRILHVYRPARIGMSRGVPWGHSCMSTLKMLDAYSEAELVAARAAASKMGFLQTPTGEDYTGEGPDADGNVIAEFEPGIIEQLPEGWEFKSFDPNSPSGAFEPFTKALLRKAASGLGVAYSSLASDLEGVNYSSIRSGVLEERQNWRKAQNWLIGSFMGPTYYDWLKTSLLMGAIGSRPLHKLDKFHAPTWQARGWEWVDPLKDEKANETSLGNLTKTRAEILAERGQDLEETFDQLKYENELAEQRGLKVKSVGGNNNGQGQVENSGT